jgi:ferredoxin-like protein FixX
MCEHCNDTGSLSQSMDGDLDCGHCDIATERAKLDAWISRKYNRGELGYRISGSDAWLIYQHGTAVQTDQHQ